MTDLHWLSAADIAKAYAARTLSPTEVKELNNLGAAKITTH